MQTPSDAITSTNPHTSTVADSSTALSSDVRLLLQFVDRVQSTGLCNYPPLEAHLHRHAETLRIQAAHPADAGVTPGAKGSETPGDKADPDGHQDPAQENVAAQPGPSPLPSHPDRGELQRRQSPPDRMEPSDPEPQLTSEQGGSPPAGLAAELAAAASHGPATQPTGPDSGPDSGEAQASGRTLLAAERFAAPDPQLDLLLQFRERVQISGLCDHPELEERLSAHLNQREMRQGNNRLALERLQQRCHQRLQQALTSLAELADALRPAETASGAESAALAACLGQLRLLLVDGLECYGSALDGPQRRMLRRQCERAAREDHHLKRLLASGAPAAMTLVRLQSLAAILAVALEQWDPDGAASVHDLPASLVPAPRQGPEPTAATNTIRRHLLPHRPCWS